jgi:uncharacterized damage-inducible protein DinB
MRSPAICGLVFIFACALSLAAQDQKEQKKPTTLRGVLLEQLHTTHDQNDWFVSVKTAVDGVTTEQANWKQGAGNHSVGQLTYHLLFWNRHTLNELKGQPQPKFSGNNEETFDNFDSKQWADTVSQLDQVLTELEKFVETADEQKLQASASTLAHIGTHNAYHVGQIVVVRQLQGSWNPDKGVK